MAERRMFAKTIIDSDAFLDMPLSTQALYFHLSMRADDEGFVNNPRKICRMIGANDDDIRVLSSKKFIIPFDSGVVVIKHWRIHNYIQTDRFHATVYKEERAQLEVTENKAYTLSKEPCIQDGYKPDTDRIQNGYPGKVRLGKDSIDQVRVEDVGIEDHQSPTPSSTIPTLYLQLSTGEMYPVTGERIEELQKAFPDIEVLPELVIMAETMRTNPAKRRTAARIEATIVNWLQIARERALERQKNAEAKAEAGAKPKKNAFGNFAQHDYNFDEIDRALDLA